MPVGRAEEELITSRHFLPAKGHNEVHFCCVTFAQLHSLTLNSKIS